MSEIPVTLTIQSAIVTVGETDGRHVVSKIAHQGSRINGDRWQVATSEADDHGPELRQLVEVISGSFEDATELATRHAVELHRLLQAKHEADEAFDALFSGEGRT